MADIELLDLNWPLPPRVRAAITTRKGGFSAGPYQGANFGDHVADDPISVAANRQQLAEQCSVSRWQWLAQVHGVDLVETGGEEIPMAIADGAITRHADIACAVLTADCLPVLLCAQDGSQVAAVHAGWRGLADGVLTHAVASFSGAGADLSAYLGPAIGPDHFEVGQDVLDAFSPWGIDAALWQQLFVPQPDKPQHYLADLYGLARWALNQTGVEHIFGGELCTYCEPDRFYSYRRDGVTGRMVSAIWLEDH